MHIILQFVLISKLYIVDFFPYQYIYYDQFTRPYILNWTEMWNFSFSLLSFILIILHRISLSDPSVQFSHSVVSNSLGPHGLQYVRLPCPSPTPGAYSNSCSLSWWCCPTTSFSVVPFSSWLQSFPALGSFLISHFFTPGGQSTGVSASTSVLSTNIQDWFPLEWTGWISLQSKGLSRVFSNTTVQKHQFLGAQPSSQSYSHIHTWPQE